MNDIKKYEIIIKDLQYKNKELEVRNDLLIKYIEKLELYFQKNNLMNDRIKYFNYATNEEIKSLKDYKDNMFAVEIPGTRLLIKSDLGYKDFLEGSEE